MEQTQEIEAPTSHKTWYVFITEMRSESTDCIRRRVMFKILKDSILKRLEEII